MRYSILEIQSFLNQLYGGRPLSVVPYGYTITFTDLVSPDVTSTQTLGITANADFVLLAIKYRQTANASQTVSNKLASLYRVLITDSGSNEQFTNSAVELESYATNGNTDQGLLPYPRFLAGRTTLTVTVSSFSTLVSTTTLDLFLEGVLVRSYSGQ
jgi:hypothetical protein